MQNFFRFHDPRPNWWLETQLADLATALTRTPSLRVSFEPVSVVRSDEELSISTFAASFVESEARGCMTAEVYLRALGTLISTDREAMATTVAGFRETSIPALSVQLLCVAEDARLAKQIGQARPGTKGPFRTRSDVYARMLKQNRPHRILAGATGDVVFTDAYLGFQGCLMTVTDEQHPPVYQDALQRCVDAVNRAVSTADVIGAVEVFIETVVTKSATEWTLSDTTYRLFDYSTELVSPSIEAADDEQSVEDERAATGGSNGDGEAEDLSRREQVDVWTQRQKTVATGAFQKRIDEDKSSPSAGSNARVGDDAPQSLATRRGHTDGGMLDDAGEAEEETSFSMSGKPRPSDVEDSDVTTIERQPAAASAKARVAAWGSQTGDAQKRLSMLFDRLLLHKMNGRYHATKSGRLDRQLTKIATEANPRLFYHKTAQDVRLDVAVQMLVDCSGSMFHQLEAIKPLIYLFHKCFQRLRIAHDVCGFWEDTLHVPKLGRQRPVTHLLHAVDWNDSSQADVAAHIDAFEPQLDNRDGLAIRYVGDALRHRPERQKWMLVISDGEPAAHDYRDAMMDTKRAVRWLQKHQIDVIHMCLAEHSDEQTRQALRQMYGDNCVIVPNLRDVPLVMERTLSTILKKVMN